MIVNAEGMIMGRLASMAAKKALLGEKVYVINCDKALITGSRKQILDHYKAKRERGSPYHGPYFPQESHLIVKRTIRGMLPYRQEKGRAALERVRCYLGVPKDLAGKEAVALEEADKARLQTKKYLTLKELSKLLGA